MLNIPNYIFEFAYFTPHLVLCLLSFFIVKKLFNNKKNKDDKPFDNRQRPPKKLDLFKTSLPMFGVTISTAVMSHFDILMLNYYTSSEAVGIYAIYVKIVVITTLASQSINSMFAPTVSKLHSANKTNELKSFAKKATLLSFGTTLTLSLGFIVIHKPFLGLYGPQFLSELTTLYILILSSVCTGFFGPVGLFLNMTGHQNTFFKIISFAAILNAILNVILIPQWGAQGAAAATLISMVTWNILATRVVLKEFQYTILWTRNAFA
jgi:O-antigen/teichoic acid export membrane protein